MDKIVSIKQRLAKKATKLLTGGFRPTNADTESWIGKVFLYKENEEIPKDNNGNLMLPLLQICLDGLPYIPEALAETKVLTIFVANELPMDLAANGDNWLIREYKKDDVLVAKDLVNNTSFLKPFPLSYQLVEADYPVWDGGGMPTEIAEEITALEDSEGVDYYDFVELGCGHKIGGYPNFCQPETCFGDNFEFQIQIASDEKANLNIVDCGNIYLAKNTKTGDWKYYCDFY